MTTRARTTTAVALVALALAGCDADPTDPAGRATPAALYLGVQVLAAFRADTGGAVVLSGNLTPGRDARGAVRTVTAPLQLDGRPLRFNPAHDRFGSVFLPSTTLRLGSRIGRAPLTVQSPTLADVTPNRPTVRLSTVRALDPDTVRLDADGALRVHIASASGDGSGDASATMRTWVISVTGAQTLTYRGDGLPPTDVVVPRDLLPPATPAGQWRVQLDFQEGHGIVYGPPTPAPATPAYDVRVLYQQLVFWTVLR